ncbi:unnamed protein product [Rotaria socialis]|uniref:Uncharacterized protein n=1 Tax=Rotaria socialis TaxID=392032 RepID=A0A821BDE9_9BILA|nr:unnamed protein product [Rotaria socialis]
MRFLLHEWRKQITYFKRNNFKNLQKARGVVNTIAFFVVWGYAGYFIANRADKTAKETGIPHSLQVAKQTGSRYITKWDLNTGETEKIGKTLINIMKFMKFSIRMLLIRCDYVKCDRFNEY